MTNQAYDERLDNPDFLAFNGINGASGEYGIPPMSEQEFAGSLAGFELDKEGANFAVTGVDDPTDLAQTGWGVIFADQDPRTEAIKEALQPLFDWRRAQTLGPYPNNPRKKAENYFKIFDGVNGYRQGESKRAFLGRYGVGSGAVDPDKGVPYYLLLVGNPQQLPYEFQIHLGVQFAVGRIYFETIDEYANYARTVVAAEKGELRREQKLSLFGVENNQDRATKMSSQYLIKPLSETLTDEFSGDDWAVEAFIKNEATKANLSNLIGGGETPALLFTASHGMEFPKDDPRQLPHQGALLCQDWPGPRRWRKPIPQDFYFAGDDIASDADIAGMVAFHFACFGGGSPMLDQYSRQSNKNREPIAPYPFIAQLPTKLLGHPKGGALAVIAHVERAWGYSFYSDEAGENITVFEGVIGDLLRGDTVGYVSELLSQRFGEIATEVTAEIDDLEYLKQQAETGNNKPLQEHLAKYGKLLTNLWTEHNDARDYIILGDPAVRLAVFDPHELPDVEALTISQPAETNQPTTRPAPLDQLTNLSLEDWERTPPPVRAALTKAVALLNDEAVLQVNEVART